MSATTRRLLNSGMVELDTVWLWARSGVGWVRVRMQETIGKVLSSKAVLVTSIEELVFMLNMSIILQCRRAILVA